MVVPVFAALAAAALYAVAGAFQHRSATDIPYTRSPRAGNLALFVRDTLHHRSWLIGTAADIVALALHVLALHLGPLALVQPLMVIGVVFALPLRHRLDHHRPAIRELLWAAALAAGLATFLTAATPVAAPAKVAAPVDRLPAVVVGALLLAGIVACAYAGRAAHGARPAVCLGTAAGLAFAATAALTKATTDIAVRHPIELVTTPPLYILIAIGACGLLLNQLAFQAGPLRTSLPAVTTVDPVISLIIGIAVYDEHLRSGSTARSIEIAALAAVIVATTALTRGQDVPAGHVPGPPSSPGGPPRAELVGPGERRRRRSRRPGGPGEVRLAPAAEPLAPEGYVCGCDVSGLACSGASTPTGRPRVP